jgi:periplasmic protein TonB
MNQPAQSRVIHPLDRPLRRLVWLAPAAALVWILILAGFASLLSNHNAERSVQPLEVSLADLGHGIPGGSAGGGPRASSGGAGAGITSRGPVKVAPRAATAVTAPPQPKHPAWARERALIPPAAKRRREFRALPVNTLGEEAVFSRNAHARHEDEEAPATGGAITAAASGAAAAPQPKAEDRAVSLSDAAGGGAGAASGNIAGAGSDASAGPGSGGEGGGTGGGVGAGDQVYATVEHPPVPISRILPEYPGAARSQGVEGEVVLRAIVDQRGAVERDVVVVQSIPMLDRAAIEALRQWRFEPGRDGGNHAVRVVIEVPLRFRLR